MLRSLYLLAILPVFSALAQTTTPSSSPSKTLDGMMACRSVTDAAARLACYDQRVEALQTATEHRDVVVVDRSEIQKARHSLFGFNLPSLAVFGDGKDSKGRQVVEEEEQISSTIRSATQDGMGAWVITLQDGAVWHQTSDQAFGVRPKPGDPITIRRASLGSYIMKVGKQPGVKAKREG